MCLCVLEGAAGSGGGREGNALGGAGGGGSVEHAVGVGVAAAGHDGRRGRRDGCDGVDEALWRGRLREDETCLCVRACVRVRAFIYACGRVGARACKGREGGGTEEAGGRRRGGKSSSGRSRQTESFVVPDSPLPPQSVCPSGPPDSQDPSFRPRSNILETEHSSVFGAKLRD